jgi:hypothetical protein
MKIVDQKSSKNKRICSAYLNTPKSRLLIEDKSFIRNLVEDITHLLFEDVDEIALLSN